jgi:hypothetical protein
MSQPKPWTPADGAPSDVHNETPDELTCDFLIYVQAPSQAQHQTLATAIDQSYM